MADETTHQHLSVDSAPTALILFLGRKASREEPTCFVVVVFANRIVMGSTCLRGFGKFGLRTDTYCAFLLFMFFLSWETGHFKVFQFYFEQSEAPSVNKCMLDRDGALRANSVFFRDTTIIDALNPGNIKTETGSVMTFVDVWVLRPFVILNYRMGVPILE